MHLVKRHAVKHDMNNKTAKGLMKEQNITQEELARRLGVTQSMVSRWLNPKADPKVSTLRRIADAMGVHIAELGRTYDAWNKLPMGSELDQDPWE
jgi:transcriptional regulator with XRE-family HTH domain